MLGRILQWLFKRSRHDESVFDFDYLGEDERTFEIARHPDSDDELFQEPSPLE